MRTLAGGPNAEKVAIGSEEGGPASLGEGRKESHRDGNLGERRKRKQGTHEGNFGESKESKERFLAP